MLTRIVERVASPGYGEEDNVVLRGQKTANVLALYFGFFSILPWYSNHHDSHGAVARQTIRRAVACFVYSDSWFDGFGWVQGIAFCLYGFAPVWNFVFPCYSCKLPTQDSLPQQSCALLLDKNSFGVPTFVPLHSAPPPPHPRLAGTPFL